MQAVVTKRRISHLADFCREPQFTGAMLTWHSAPALSASRSESVLETRRKAPTPPSDSASPSSGSADRAGAAMSWSPSLSTPPRPATSSSCTSNRLSTLRNTQVVAHGGLCLLYSQHGLRHEQVARADKRHIGAAKRVPASSMATYCWLEAATKKQQMPRGMFLSTPKPATWWSTALRVCLPDGRH